MAEGKAHESSVSKIKEHMKHGAERIKHIRFPRHSSDGVSKEDHPLDEPRLKSEDLPARSKEASHVKVDRSNIEDFPYDEATEDEFTAELASAVAEADDGISSPKSQASTRSMDTVHSSVSELSWASNQKTILGLGVSERRSKELLGPYKPHEKGAGPVPPEYHDYIKHNNVPSDETTLSEGNTAVDRSSSEPSVADSLYADLSSISDRDLHVPEGLIEADGSDSVCNSEGSLSPKQNLRVRQHIADLKLNE